MHRRVVQVLDRASLGAEHDQVEQDDDAHHDERPPWGGLGARRFALDGRGRLFAFGQGLAHSLMLPRLRSQARSAGRSLRRYEPARGAGSRARAVTSHALGVSAASIVPLIRFVSIGTPGPIVVETVRVFTYLPLAAEGRARMISSTTAR